MWRDELADAEAAESGPLRGRVDDPGRSSVPRSVTPKRVGEMPAVATGTLLALFEHGDRAVVRRGDAGPAVTARTTVDLDGRHIGGSVLLVFDEGDAARPIVIGVLRGGAAAAHGVQVDIDADGDRMIVAAGRQLVLRCGAASITLASSGKIVIDGTYVLSRSSGVNRIDGGSIQLN